MSDSNVGLGWLPVSARDVLEEQRDRASNEEAERLLALSPRARVLELMTRVAGHNADENPMPPLRPAELRRLLESFAGEEKLSEEDLAERFPMLVLEAS